MSNLFIIETNSYKLLGTAFLTHLTDGEPLSVAIGHIRMPFAHRETCLGSTWIFIGAHELAKRLLLLISRTIEESSKLRELLRSWTFADPTQQGPLASASGRVPLGIRRLHSQLIEGRPS